MKMKNILIFLIIILACNKFNYSQITFRIIENKPMTKIIHEEIDSLGNERKTYVTYDHSMLEEAAIDIFTLKNDTLEEYYSLMSSGKLLHYLEYKNNLTWNSHYSNSKRNSLDEITNGDGIRYYHDIITIKSGYSFEYIRSDTVYSRDIIRNGAVIIREYLYGNNGRVTGYSLNNAKKHTYYDIYSDTSDYYILDSSGCYVKSSDTNVIATIHNLYRPGYMFYKDTLFQLTEGHYIVTGYWEDGKINETESLIRIMPKDYYIPDIYYNIERAIFLRKYKRKCQRWYNKYNGFTDAYFEKRDVFLNENESSSSFHNTYRDTSKTNYLIFY